MNITTLKPAEYGRKLAKMWSVAIHGYRGKLSTGAFEHITRLLVEELNQIEVEQRQRFDRAINNLGAAFSGLSEHASAARQAFEAWPKIQDRINAAYASGELEPVDVGPDEPSGEIVDCLGGTLLTRSGRLWWCPEDEE